MPKIEITKQNCIATTYPEIVLQWHPILNGELTPDKVKAGSSKKVWWICEKGHEWQAMICHRTKNNSNCPYCSGRYTIKGENDLQTLMPSIAKEWHPTKNRCLLPTDVKPGSNKKIWWRCKEGHEWQAVISTRTGKNNCGCPYCAGRYAISGVNDLATLNPELVKEWNYKKNESLLCSEVKIASNKRVWWICEKGHEWQAAISGRTKENGTGCPYCLGYLAIPGETDLATINPELVLEWNAKKNKRHDITKITAHSSKKVWWICEKGHEWRAAVNTRSYGSGCPFCLKEKK